MPLSVVNPEARVGEEHDVTSSNGRGDGVLTNTVTASGSPVMGTPSPATATATVAVNPAQPALSITKSVSNTFVKVTADPNNTGTAPLPASQLSPSQLVYTLPPSETGSTCFRVSIK